MSYRNLLTYQQAEEIYDLTALFCDRHLHWRDNRLREQMIHGARSGKQNIAEGASQGTSLKGYIKLVGIARGSLEELLEDYLDFARQRGIPIWERGDERIEKVKRVEKGEMVKLLFPSTPSTPSSPSLPSPLLINYLVDLIKRTNYLLDRQRKSLEEKFVREGGYTENLRRRRIEKKVKGLW